MRISTRGEYGVRAMLDLALHFRQGPVALKSIADRQGISETYLEQLIAPLRKAGLVSSIRGANGGYELSREPHEIKIGEIIRVLEGPIAPMGCASESPQHFACDNSRKCAARVLWQRLRDRISEFLDSTSLGELLDEPLDDCSESHIEADFK